MLSSEDGIAMDRRDFLRAGGATFGALAGLGSLLPTYAWCAEGIGVSRAGRGDQVFDLAIGRTAVRIGDRSASAVTVNGSVPAPLLRFREGETVTLHVANALDEDTSIHWHGIILPNGMDGVPKVTFAGIRPGEPFTYHYPVRQSGTYW